MGLIDYIKGKRYGKEANKLERESMEDPFLQEALDGYDVVISNHIDSIERLEDQITQQSKVRKQNKLTFYWSVAAGVVLVLGVGSAIIFSSSDDELIADNNVEQLEESDAVMDEFNENIMYDSVPIVDNRIVIVEDKPIVDKEIKKEEIADVKAKDELVKNDVASSEDKIMASGTDVSDVNSKEVSMAKVSNKRLEEVANAGKSLSMEAAANSLTPEVEVEKKKESVKEFEKGEFKSYFFSKVKKTGENSVEVEFVLNDGQRPSSVKIKDASSDVAKKEALRIINSSPQWTEKSGKKIKLKLKW